MEMSENISIREQQDKRWGELTDELKESIRLNYHMMHELYPNGAGAKGIEDKYGKHNVGMD